ncbi:MAG: TdeIII family type II restriction endonuclease [Verrucomicrobiota bacterium]|nr:TdeIII family type II restriction endonuclease [Verrucomicrobiota bacterium]
MIFESLDFLITHGLHRFHASGFHVGCFVVFESIAAILARPHFRHAEAQYKILNPNISAAAQLEIQSIIDELTTSQTKPDKAAEIERIRKVATVGTIKKIKKPRVDLHLIAHDGTEYYFDLKTAKPNMDEFKAHKRKMLEWVAYRLQLSPKAKLKTALAIPYNPYEPEPYERWTLAGLYDLKEEILVAHELWDFLGGKGAYEELLKIFEEVGILLRPEIDVRFAKFK